MPFHGAVFTPFFRTPPLPAPPARRSLIRLPVSLAPATEEAVTSVTPAGEPFVLSPTGNTQAAFNSAGWIAVAPSGRVVVCFAYRVGKQPLLGVWTRTAASGWEDLSASIATDGYVGDGAVFSPTVRALPGRDESFGIAFILDGALAYRELRWSGLTYGLDVAWDHAMRNATLDNPSLGHDASGTAWVAVGATERFAKSIQLVRGNSRGVTRREVRRGGATPSLPSLAVGETQGVVVWRELDVPGSTSFYTTVAASFSLSARGSVGTFPFQPLAGYRVDGSSAWDPSVGHAGADGFIAAWQGRARGQTPVIWNAGSLDGGVTWTTPVEVCDDTIRAVNEFAQVVADADSGLAAVVWEGTGGGPKLASAAAVSLSRSRPTVLSLPDQYVSPRGDNGLADDVPVAPAVRGLPDASRPTLCLTGGRLHLAWFAIGTTGRTVLRYREATW